jgi:hypothetical protein
MPLKFKYTLNRDYLKVEILGHRTPGNELLESKEIWKQIADVVKRENQDRILTLIKVKGHLPVKAAYQIAESAGSIGWSHNYKLAVVAGSDTVLMNVRLSEMIMTKLGYDMKLFGSTRMARKWLLSD